MLIVATCLWAKNRHTNPLSGVYSEMWVERLYRGFKRSLTIPFEFVCFVDFKRVFKEPIRQELLSNIAPDYSNFTEPYKLNEPMILVGLDTVIVGNIDQFAAWCLEGDKIALMRDVKSYRLKDQGYPDQSINGVALVPKGWRKVYDGWKQGMNDMQHLRKYPWVAIDDKWGREAIVSYKMQVRSNENRLNRDARIVYFHGQPKMDSVAHLPWMQQHWR